MRRYAGLLTGLCGKNPADVAGCGAGGGIAAPLLAMTSAEIRSGIQAVLEAVGFAEHLMTADLVITGEGKLDAQSLYGKTVSGVVTEARVHHIPVYCFAGCLGEQKQTLLAMGLAGIEVLNEIAPDPEDSMKRAAFYLEQLAMRFAKQLA